MSFSDRGFWLPTHRAVSSSSDRGRETPAAWMRGILTHSLDWKPSWMFLGNLREINNFIISCCPQKSERDLCGHIISISYVQVNLSVVNLKRLRRWGRPEVVVMTRTVGELHERKTDRSSPSLIPLLLPYPWLEEYYMNFSQYWMIGRFFL